MRLCSAAGHAATLPRTTVAAITASKSTITVSSPLSSPNEPAFCEREVVPVADDDVIVHRKVEELARLDQLPCNRSVILRRRRIATRVVVGNDDPRRAIRDGTDENLTRMHEAGRERSACDLVQADDSCLRVERNQVEDFA